MWAVAAPGHGAPTSKSGAYSLGAWCSHKTRTCLSKLEHAGAAGFLTRGAAERQKVGAGAKGGGRSWPENCAIGVCIEEGESKDYQQAETVGGYSLSIQWAPLLSRILAASACFFSPYLYFH